MFVPTLVKVAFLTGVLSAPPLDIVVLDSGVNTESAHEVAQTLHVSATLLDGFVPPSSPSLLVVPNAATFPGAGLDLIKDYLAHGGHLLAVGGPAFETLVYRTENKQWVSETELFASVAPAHPLINWNAVDLKTTGRGTSQPDAPADYRKVENGMAGDTDMKDPLGWETKEIPCAIPPPARDNVIRFRASGSGAATSMLMEAREKDGTRWMAVIPLTSEEREVGVHINAFSFWRDSTSQARGGPGDHLRLENLTSVVFGFAQSHQALKPGHYGFVVRNLATGALDASFTRPEPLILEGLSPSYKLFKARPNRYERLADAAGISFDYPETVLSAVARGQRLVPGSNYVWQPLIKAYDREGVWCATPAATTWHRSGATWTFLGFMPKPAALAEFCRHLAQSLAQTPAFEEGVGPLVTAGPPGNCVAVEGDHFVLDGKRWFANGINFWPLYVSGLEPSEYFFNWLAPQFYFPELVETDLKTLQSLGVNLLSIQYGKVEEAPQLVDFAARCGRYGIKVNVFLSDAHPTFPNADDDLTQRAYLPLMRAAQLAGNPNVFAYDLAWEPKLGNAKDRQPLAPLFDAWVREQYGSLEHAEALWGVAANRNQDKMAGPSDEQIVKDGPHRVMVAAYRRFLDDLISRRYREVIRLAREIDDTHLFGVRTGYGGTGTEGVVPMMPFQVTGGAAHLDFISPEGYGYGPGNIADAALVNQYARWAGHGKPVFWAEFGLSVWNGGEAALTTQENLYAAFADMVRNSGAAGWAPWWYPGGYRVDERSDYGIIAPDRTLRPSAGILKRAAAAASSPPLPPGAKLAFTRDGQPGGIAAVVRDLSPAFAQEYQAGHLPALKTAGTGATSANCPLTSVGGIAYQAPAPPEYLNAELWISKREAGQMFVTLLNTGEAAWSKDDCALHLKTAKDTTSVALPQDVAPFAKITVACPIPVQTATTVMHADRFDEFGERLIVEH